VTVIERIRSRRLSIDPGAAEDGSAIIEFVFISIVIMVPFVYLVVAVATVQHRSLAVTAAAQSAGRAFATADTSEHGLARARAAARLALEDQGIKQAPQLEFHDGASGCSGPLVAPQLTQGAVFTVCVRQSFPLPGVPTVLSPRGVTTVGEYVVHVDDFWSQ